MSEIEYTTIKSIDNNRNVVITCVGHQIGGVSEVHYNVEHKRGRILKTARLEDGSLILDGENRICMAHYKGPFSVYEVNEVHGEPMKLLFTNETSFSVPERLYPDGVFWVQKDDA